MYEEVYYMEASDDYNVDMSTNLDNVATEEDCENNALTLLRTYECEIIASCITGFDSVYKD